MTHIHQQHQSSRSCSADFSLLTFHISCWGTGRKGPIPPVHQKLKKAENKNIQHLSFMVASASQGKAIWIKPARSLYGSPSECHVRQTFSLALLRYFWLQNGWQWKRHQTATVQTAPASPSAKGLCSHRFLSSSPERAPLESQGLTTWKKSPRLTLHLSWWSFSTGIILPSSPGVLPPPVLLLFGHQEGRCQPRSALTIGEHCQQHQQLNMLQVCCHPSPCEAATLWRKDHFQTSNSAISWNSSYRTHYYCSDPHPCCWENGILKAQM